MKTPNKKKNNLQETCVRVCFWDLDPIQGASEVAEISNPLGTRERVIFRRVNARAGEKKHCR